MRYIKRSGVQGAWVKGSEVVSGTKAKLVSETIPQESEYGMQDVAKVRIQGDAETKNVRINSPTLNALIESFGDDSKDWINKILTIQTEKMNVGGRRVTALYLIPEGFEIGEDAGGYIVITRKENKEYKDGEVSPDKVPNISDEDIAF